MGFHLESPFQPAGDQPRAIKSIVDAFLKGDHYHVLLGVTGSGKTFTMANVISQLDKSAIIIAPNKTLAAQLYAELKEFFPKDPVGYFISYYDYYQPEAYVPSTDTYIAKDSAVNDDIDTMRHEATMYLFEKPRAIVVASVSCIYGLGSPASYGEMVVAIEKLEKMSRDAFLKALIGIQYSRNDAQFGRGYFRVRGDIVDIQPSHENEKAIRVSFFGDEIEEIFIIDALTGKTLCEVDKISIYPNSHYVADQKNLKVIVQQILADLGERLRILKIQNKLVELQRLEQRTMQDVETIEQLGFCPGIENYSRYLTGKGPGEPPPCLLDYFPEDFLVIVDESHITLPQIGGMYRGDRARKQTLVDFGFRLPSALDNRPLNFEEFLARTHRMLLVSATPSEFDLKLAQGHISEQVIRPTGLVDPVIIIKPARAQVDDLFYEMRSTIEEQGRVLIITITKKMAEELTDHYCNLGLKVRYLHSDLNAIERTVLLRDLRKGVFDVLIGINLLREGLDLPEVQLVAVMDADKEGFLRSKTSLIQIVGRASRNENARVIFYADRITQSMEAAMDETSRRRTLQLEYNQLHNITPRSVAKPIYGDLKTLHGFACPEVLSPQVESERVLKQYEITSLKDLEALIAKKTKDMKLKASALEFEKAMMVRDEIKALKNAQLYFSESVS